MTTTITAIREKMESVIGSLSPDSRSSVPFRVTRGESDFRRWCERNAASCLRRFYVDQVDEVELIAGDMDVEIQRALVEVVVAYDNLWSGYGGDGYQSMLSVLHEDRIKIGSAIGVLGSSNYVEGQYSSDDPDGGLIDEGQSVTFLQLLFDVTYERATEAA